jgi:murein DD-endopeptidase MepM/ murein hydrolase activator NlpD
MLALLAGCSIFRPAAKPGASARESAFPAARESRQGDGLAEVRRVLGAPGASASAVAAPCPRGAKGAAVATVASKPCPRPGVSGAGLVWPMNCGSVSRGFGAAGSTHRGLDICAPQGTPVFAARGGRVLYSGSRLSGYGNVVIIEHGGGLATVYGHNRKNLVKAGQTVSQGQIIAEVGQTGNATTPHCHFEVRRDSTAVDPRPMLL